MTQTHDCHWIDARAQNELATVSFNVDTGMVTYHATAMYWHAASPPWPYTFDARGTLRIPQFRYRRVNSEEFVHNLTFRWASWFWRGDGPYKRIMIIPMPNVRPGPIPDLRHRILPPAPPPPPEPPADTGSSPNEDGTPSRRRMWMPPPAGPRLLGRGLDGDAPQSSNDADTRRVAFAFPSSGESGDTNGGHTSSGQELGSPNAQPSGVDL